MWFMRKITYSSLITYSQYIYIYTYNFVGIM